jgi:ribosome-binding factor A
MESTRQKKVSRLVQKELAVYFQRESRNHFGSALITVTIVRVSPDLSHARVYLSLFKAPKPEELMEAIKGMNKLELLVVADPHPTTFAALNARCSCRNAADIYSCSR